jgi:hypothetical protein
MASDRRGRSNAWCRRQAVSQFSAALRACERGAARRRGAPGDRRGKRLPEGSLPMESTDDPVCPRARFLAPVGVAIERERERGDPQRWRARREPAARKPQSCGSRLWAVSGSDARGPRDGAASQAHRTAAGHRIVAPKVTGSIPAGHPHSLRNMNGRGRGSAAPSGAVPVRCLSGCPWVPRWAWPAWRRHPTLLATWEQTSSSVRSGRAEAASLRFGTVDLGAARAPSTWKEVQVCAGSDRWRPSLPW